MNDDKFLWVVLIIFIVLISLAIKYWQITFLILLIILVVIIVFIIRDNKKYKEESQRRKEEDIKQKKEQEEKERIRIKEAYDKEQHIIHQSLLDLVNTSVTLFSRLSEEINVAEHSLDEAEKEFSDGTFAPFWDAVEQAVTHIALFDQGINEIIYNYTIYKQKQKEFGSTPPSFKLDIHTLPNASSTTNRLRNIVRQAQRDFHFATIYEQRKTNQILVKGFQNLGQALSEMTSRIESSMDALSASFSDSISDLAISNQESAQEIIAGVESVKDYLKSESDARRDHEEKEREMLDNIQHQKKTFP